MRKRTLLLVLIIFFLVGLSFVNAFDFKDTDLNEITGNAIKGDFFENIWNFIRGLFGMEPIGAPRPPEPAPEPECGDGVINAGEQCDGNDFGVYGNGINKCNTYSNQYSAGNLICTNNCVIGVSGCAQGVCGDGYLNLGEDCDDGNTISGDGCSSGCMLEYLPTCEDDDSDGYGTNPQTNMYCSGGTQVDCNDNNPSINPGADEVCDNDQDDDCDNLINCNDGDCVNDPACTSPPEVELCDNGVDDDNDGIVDWLDSDCGNVSLTLNNLIIHGEPYYQYSYISSIDCYYALIPDWDVDENSLQNCIKLNVSGIDCGFYDTKQPTFVKFNDCYVGEETGTKTVECYVNDFCSVGTSDSVTEDLDILEFSTCNDGQVPSNVESFISVLSILEPEEDSEFGLEETFDIEVEVQQDIDDGVDIVVEADLVDTNDNMDSVLSNSEKPEQTIEMDEGDEETFELNMTIPEDLDEDHNYRLFVKAYEEGHESDYCRSESIAIDISEECWDNDNDGYDNESCGGTDCDDDDENINPGVAEICNDGVDNNCNGLTDNADSNCVDGGEGPFCDSLWNCTSWQPDPCLAGEIQTRTCIDLNNCGTDDNKPSESRACPMGGGYGVTDNDLDGLSDEWEYTYFGNLDQGPNDDFDGDGYTNAQEYVRGTNPKVSDEDGGSNIITILLVILIVLIIAGGVIFFYFKLKEKKKKTSQTDSVSLAYRRLVDYVRKSRAIGANDNEIRMRLLKVGWKKKGVEGVLRNVK